MTGSWRLRWPTRSTTPPVFAVLASPPKGGLDDQAYRRALQLLALLVLAACARHESADAAAVSAWATLVRMQPRRSGIPDDWRRVATAVPVSEADLQQALNGAVTAGLQDLLAGALAAVRRPLMEPLRDVEATRAQLEATPAPSADAAAVVLPAHGGLGFDQQASPHKPDSDGPSDADADGFGDSDGDGELDAFDQDAGPDGQADENNDRRAETCRDEANEEADDGAQQADQVAPHRAASRGPSNSKRGALDDSLARDNAIGWLIKSDNQARHSPDVSISRASSTACIRARHKPSGSASWRLGGRAIRRIVVRVLLAHLSQRSALPARLALELRLDATQSMRLDVQTGRVVWDYRAALASAPVESVPTNERADFGHDIGLVLDADMGPGPAPVPHAASPCGYGCTAAGCR